MFPNRNFGYSRFVLIVSIAFFVFGVVSAAKKLDSRWTGPSGISMNSFPAKTSASKSATTERPGNRINVNSIQAFGQNARTYGFQGAASELNQGQQRADGRDQFS